MPDLMPHTISFCRVVRLRSPQSPVRWEQGMMLFDVMISRRRALPRTGFYGCLDLYCARYRGRARARAGRDRGSQTEDPGRVI